MRAKAETETHALTVAGIVALTRKYNGLRHAATEELAGLFSAAEAGQPVPTPPPQAEAIRNRALTLLNGFAPDNFKLPPATPRREQLLIEVAALDEVLHALSQRELIVRNTEAELYVMQHIAEWNEICRVELLSAVRAKARERDAVAFRQKLGGVIPTSLPLAAFIGVGKLFLAGAGDQLGRALDMALELKIIGPRELKDAENA